MVGKISSSRNLLVGALALALFTGFLWAGTIVAGLSDQIADGEGMYVDNCSSCHGKNLGGKSAPSLIGEGFFTSLSSRNIETAKELYNYLKATMPYHRPGALSDQQYLFITCFLLWQNGIDLGGEVSVGDLKGVKLP